MLLSEKWRNVAEKRCWRLQTTSHLQRSDSNWAATWYAATSLKTAIFCLQRPCSVSMEGTCDSSLVYSLPKVSNIACYDPSMLQAHATLHKTSRVFFPDRERRCPATASSHAELHFMDLLTMLSVGGTVKNIFENNVHCLDVKWFVTLQMSTFFDCWHSRYYDYSTLRLKNTLFILRSDYFGNKGIIVLFPGICTTWLNLVKVCSRIEMFLMESKHQWALS